jgi:hypothetical protein
MLQNHLPRLPPFHFDEIRIRILFFTSMRIRIQIPKTLWLREGPDPDPQHCCPLSLRLTPFLPLFMPRSSLLGNRNANPLSNQFCMGRKGGGGRGGKGGKFFFWIKFSKHKAYILKAGIKIYVDTILLTNMKEWYSQHFWIVKKFSIVFQIQFSSQLFTSRKIVHIDENPRTRRAIFLRERTLHISCLLLYSTMYCYTTYITSVVSGPGMSSMSSSRNLLGGDVLRKAGSTLDFHLYLIFSMGYLVLRICE